MLISGSVRNMDDLSDLQDWLFRTATDANENGTNYSSENSTATVSASTAASSLYPATTTTTARPTPTNSSSHELQYYVIGVYGFFATLFAIGIIMIVARKLYRACCASSKPVDYYDSMPRHGVVGSVDPVVSAGQVNVDFLEVERTCQGQESDFDYYDSDNETSFPKDKPPAYEDPPAYAAVLQT